MRDTIHFFLIFLACSMLGCPGFGDEVGALEEAPDRPTWDDHVSPIMDRYCNECHSVPAEQGAPGIFRLDECEDGEVGGAQTFATSSALQTAVLRAMPPATYAPQPSDIEREVLQRWVQTGAPCEGEGMVPTEDPDSDAGM